MSKVLIIGGGPAGMIAGIEAARLGHRVSLFEKNEKLGKKLFITGKGRCNLTNDCEKEELLKNVVTNPKFLYRAFNDFDSRQMMAYMGQLGVRLKTERGNRVFPVSDHSSDIIRALEKELGRLGVQIFLDTPVKEVLTKDGRVTGLRVEGQESRGKESSGKESRGKESRRDSAAAAPGTSAGKKTDRQVSGDAVILATGGLSYPSTGSTGDGYLFAAKLGHTIRPTSPSLVPLLCKEDYIPELQGLSLKTQVFRSVMRKRSCTRISGRCSLRTTAFPVP